MEKVRSLLTTADAALVLLEPGETDEESRTSDWLLAEYGMAAQAGKVATFITVGDAKAPPPALAETECVKLPLEPDLGAMMRLVHFLHALGRRLGTVQAPDRHYKPPFIRRSVKHRTKVLRDNRIQYETQVELLCCEDGLSDVYHSIYPNRRLCPATAAGAPDVNLVNTGVGHDFTLTSVASDVAKHTWKLDITPPLASGEEIRYGYTCEFATARAVATLPLNEPVIHHYYINHVTEVLEMDVHCETGVRFDRVGCAAHVGRTIADATHRKEESSRIALTSAPFLDEWQIKLRVERPRLGFTYVISWYPATEADIVQVGRNNNP